MMIGIIVLANFRNNVSYHSMVILYFKFIRSFSALAFLTT